MCGVAESKTKLPGLITLGSPGLDVLPTQSTSEGTGRILSGILALGVTLKSVEMTGTTCIPVGQFSDSVREIVMPVGGGPPPGGIVIEPPTMTF